MKPHWTPEEQKVLNAFLDGDRIIRLPAKQKKRLVILRWLLARIEPVKRYPEAELNALIQHHHADCATIRRELFEFGFMNREHSIYWRADNAPDAPSLRQENLLT